MIPEISTKELLEELNKATAEMQERIARLDKWAEEANKDLQNLNYIRRR